MKLYYLYLLCISLFFNFSHSLADHHLQYPNLKSGYWEIIDKATKKKAHSCLESTSPKKVVGAFVETFGPLCSKNSIVKLSDSSPSNLKYKGDFLCNAGPAQWSINVLVEGDFKKRYAARVISKISPQVVSNVNSDMQLVGIHRGACPGNLKPGEIIYPDGRKINIVQSVKRMPGDITRAANASIKKLSKDFLKGLARSLPQ